MDKLIIPTCAMNRQCGTVIVKTENLDCCGRTSSDSKSYVRMPAKCEMCRRTRINSRYSECDSDNEKKCRRYRSRAARSRYLNVCAAVCLLLLVGLSPASAAPSGRRKMASRLEENRLWGNPCDYTDDAKLPNGLPKVPTLYTPEVAKRVANKARSALSTAEKFKDVLAKTLFSYDKFDDVLPQWDGTPWLRSAAVQALVPKETLHKEKTRIGQLVSEDYLKDVVSNLNDTLPSVHKTLKMVIAGLYSVKEHGFNQDLAAEIALRDNVAVTMNHCRLVLCDLNDLMSALTISTIPLTDDEIPDVREGDRLSNVFVIYRDTLLFLDSLAQLMARVAQA